MANTTDRAAGEILGGGSLPGFVVWSFNGSSLFVRFANGRADCPSLVDCAAILRRLGIEAIGLRAVQVGGVAGAPRVWAVDFDRL